MPVVFLGFGSNIGDKLGNIEKAVKLLKNLQGTEILKLSSVYETEPWGKSSSEDYYNSAAMIDTQLSAGELLKSLKRIEAEAGRTANEKWSDREIDIDLLFYGNEVHENEKLKIPHPEIENRKFVLIPMKEIAPDFVHPLLNKSITELLNETKDTLRVKRLNFQIIQNNK